MKELLILLIFIIPFTSCVTLDKHDGKVVKDSKGKYYLLEHSIGDFYIVSEKEGVVINGKYYVKDKEEVENSYDDKGL